MKHAQLIPASASLACALAAGATAKEPQPGDDRGGHGKSFMAQVG